MVVAGPGTGKTQILTLRIANILRKTDTSPDSILALTFTEAGVVAMRKRLVEIMGSEAYRVGIYTFHGFANDLIRRYPDEYPRIVGSKSINDIDKIRILKEIIKSEKLERLKPFGDPFYYLHSIRSAVSKLKRENIDSNEARARVKKEKEEYAGIADLRYESGPHKGAMRGKYRNLEKQIEKDEELALVYKRYEEELCNRKLYDYEDMITETVHALERKRDFLLQLEEQYQYILADEHQDANNSQNRLLELLSSFHKSPNLFLVGDEKQAIYRFQGASLENFLYFAKQFPDALVIQLSKNYRSRQPILNASHSLIEKGVRGEHERDKPLESNMVGKEEPISVISFSRSEFEYAYIASDIKRLISEGVEPSEIAILYRNNNDVVPILPALEREGVPYAVESDQNVLADKDIEKFISLLRAVHFFGREECLIRVLYIDFLNIDPLDIYKILRFRSREHVPLPDLMKSEEMLRSAKVEGVKEVKDIYRKLSSWSIFASNHGILESLEVIANESGFWGHIIGHLRAQEKLDEYSGLVRNIEALVEAHRDYTLGDLMEYLDLLKEHNVLIKRTRRYSRSSAVRLMTAHKAKGLEFDQVYLPGAVLGHWGNRRIIEHFSINVAPDDVGHDPLLDERRLFYVALTRARDGVSISYAQESSEGKEQLPSQFIEEIDKHLLKGKSMESFEREQKPEKLLAPRSPVSLPVTEQRYLQELFLEQGLSVTALNNYLRDPWEYFFGNLLRVPKAPSKSMLYGKAIHGALNDFFERMKEGGEYNKEYLLSRFRAHLSYQPLSLHEYEESVQKGERSLSGYYDEYKSKFIPAVRNEFSIRMSFEVGNGQSIVLRGILDKVERVSERYVRVVDYKTGPVRTLNDILGKTKSSTGDYFRQLVFYKLLLSNYENGMFDMASGAIDFIEPRKNGSYSLEEFTISDRDVEDLKELIRKVSEEILDFEFWDKPCDPKKSGFCGLRELLKEHNERS